MDPGIKIPERDQRKNLDQLPDLPVVISNKSLTDF